MHFSRNRCSLLCFINHIKYMMIYLTTPATVVICSCDSLLRVFYRWCLKSGDNFFTTFWAPSAANGPEPSYGRNQKNRISWVSERKAIWKKEKRELANPLCVHGKLRSGLGFPRSCQVPNQICRECTEIPAIDGLRIYRTFTKAPTRAGL